MESSRTAVLVALAGLIVVAGFGAWSIFHRRLLLIYTYEECANAGYPVMESYPPRCAVPDGRTFTQDIGNELELSDPADLPEHAQAVRVPVVIAPQ